MKVNMILTVAILIVCLALTACNMDHVNIPDFSDDAGISAERANLTIEEYSDYTKFIKIADLPENFVTYDELSHFGSFSAFICTSDSSRNDYSRYSYKFIDDNGVKFNISISPAGSGPSHRPEDLMISDTSSKGITINKSNMLHAPSDSRIVYTYGGIEYQYISGTLCWISWEDNDWYYCILTNHFSKDSQFAETTPFASLLNIANTTPVQLQTVLAPESAD